MKRRFKIKKHTRSGNFVFLLLMTGFLIILLFAYSSQFPELEEQFDANYKNIEITFFDHSVQKENPSGKVVINGQLVYQVDSISNSIYQDTKINLKQGKHILEISTIDNQYKLIDTIEVTQYPIVYKLSIQYNYNPPIDKHKMVVIDYLYQKSINEKSYTENQKLSLLEQATKQINQEFESGLTYVPNNRHFTFSFKDVTHYPVE